MENLHAIDHIAEDHIHTDITCNIEEPQQKYRLGTILLSTAHTNKRFFTPAEENYYLMEDYGLSVLGKNTFLFEILKSSFKSREDIQKEEHGPDFEVQACSNVHILLMKDRDNFDENVYEIVIGEKSNSRSVIRKGRQNDSVAMVNHQLLDCQQLKTFWISWANSSVKVGSVTFRELLVFLSFADDSPPFINFLAVATKNASTGHWLFDNNEFTSECCSYEALDCYDIVEHGMKESGVYSITPAGTHTSFIVYCEMDTNSEAWLVFQRRSDGSESFYRNWEAYKTGFGDPLHEFRLGNDHLYSISAQGSYTLRIDLEDLDGNRRVANYDTFTIGSPLENYKLTVGGYSGDAGDSLTYHNGRAFSTYDRDNDRCSPNCAAEYDGAWWYAGCHKSNLNGLYLNGPQTSYANGINWEAWKGYHYSLTATEMKIKRK